MSLLLNPRRRAVWFLLLGAALLSGVVFLASGRGLLAGPAHSQPLAAASPQGVPPLPGSWVRYVDLLDGFSFGYPPDAHVADSGRNPVDLSRELDLAFFVPGAGAYQGMNIRIEPYSRLLSATEIVKGTYARLTGAPPPTDLPSALIPAVAGSLPAFRTTIPPSNTEVTVIVLAGDRAFLLSPVHGPATTAVDPRTIALFNQVVATFAAY